MKTKTQFALLAFVCLMISFSAHAQNKKKYSIYVEMNKNGKEVIVDTSFTSREEMEAYMKKSGIDMPAIPPPPAIPAVPPPPAIPAVPPVPGVPAVPPVPPVPPVPDDMKNIIIQIDDSDLTFDDQEMIEEEMKKAHKEMKKAKIDMKKSEKDMDQMKEELKNLQIEIEKTGANGSQVIIRHLDGGNSVADGERKMMIINVEDDGSAESQPRIVRMNCDSLHPGGNELVFIRKSKAPEKAETVILNDNTGDEPLILEVNESESKSKSPSTGSDFQLNVSDFKLYPNPTAGYINISFKSETSGKVEIRLIDGTGRAVVEDEVEIQNGIFNKEYSIEGKSKGTYLLQIKQGDKWRHEKVVLK